MRNAFMWYWNKGLKSTTQGKILICAECCSRFNPTPHDPCSAVTCRQMSRRSPWYHHLISPLGVCFWELLWPSSLQWTGLMIPEKQAGLLGGFGLFRRNSGPSSLQLVDCPTQLSVFSMANIKEHNRKICYCLSHLVNQGGGGGGRELPQARLPQHDEQDGDVWHGWLWPRFWAQ